MTVFSVCVLVITVNVCRHVLDETASLINTAVVIRYQQEHTHIHTVSVLVFMVSWDSRHNGFYTVQTVCAIALLQPYT